MIHGAVEGPALFALADHWFHAVPVADPARGSNTRCEPPGGPTTRRPRAGGGAAPKRTLAHRRHAGQSPQSRSRARGSARTQPAAGQDPGVRKSRGGAHVPTHAHAVRVGRRPPHPRARSLAPVDLLVRHGRPGHRTLDRRAAGRARRRRGQRSAMLAGHMLLGMIHTRAGDQESARVHIDAAIRMCEEGCGSTVSGFVTRGSCRVGARVLGDESGVARSGRAGRGSKPVGRSPWRRRPTRKQRVCNHVRHVVRLGRGHDPRRRRVDPSTSARDGISIATAQGHGMMFVPFLAAHLGWAIAREGEIDDGRRADRGQRHGSSRDRRRDVAARLRCVGGGCLPGRQPVRRRARARRSGVGGPRFRRRTVVRGGVASAPRAGASGLGRLRPPSRPGVRDGDRHGRTAGCWRVQAARLAGEHWPASQGPLAAP